jgi:hypothetical protein
MPVNSDLLLTDRGGLAHESLAFTLNCLGGTFEVSEALYLRESSA